MQDSTGTKYGIVIPCYNRGKVVGRCIDSIIKAYHNGPYKGGLVIVIVNDGSTDNSQEICENISYECTQGDIFIEVIKKENGSCSQARATGIRQLGTIHNCEYVVNIDADDYVNDNMFSELERITSDYKDVDILLMNFEAYENGVGKPYYYTASNVEMLVGMVMPTEMKLVTDITNPIIAKLAKTELWMKCIDGLKSYINCGEDLILDTLLFSVAKTMVYTDAMYYVYEVNSPGSIVAATDYKEKPKDLQFALNMAYALEISQSLERSLKP